jgi:hypothetical protein
MFARMLIFRALVPSRPRALTNKLLQHLQLLGLATGNQLLHQCRHAQVAHRVGAADRANQLLGVLQQIAFAGLVIGEGLVQ